MTNMIPYVLVKTQSEKMTGILRIKYVPFDSLDKIIYRQTRL